MDDRLPDEANALARWLVRAREKAGMSVPELAEASGLSAQSIYNIESGRSANPRSTTRRKLEKALKTTVPEDVMEATEESSNIEGLGAFTDFNPYQADDVPPHPGVYVFYDVSDRPIYIGQAGDIKRRVKDHSTQFWFKQPIVVRAAYVRIGKRKLRHQIEQILIKFLKSNAVINKQSVER